MRLDRRLHRPNIDAMVRRDDVPGPGPGPDAITRETQPPVGWAVIPAMCTRRAMRDINPEPGLNDLVGWPGGISPPGSHRIRT